MSHCNLTWKICEVIRYKNMNYYQCVWFQNHRYLILRNPKIQCANRLVILILALYAPSVLQCIKISTPYNVYNFKDKNIRPAESTSWFFQSLQAMLLNLYRWRCILVFEKCSVTISAGTSTILNIFLWFSSVLSGKFWDSTSIRPRLLFSVVLTLDAIQSEMLTGSWDKPWKAPFYNNTLYKKSSFTGKQRVACLNFSSEWTVVI
jgi:hypothetical protein